MDQVATALIDMRSRLEKRGSFYQVLALCLVLGMVPRTARCQGCYFASEYREASALARALLLKL